jgi:hypothetical protein
MSDILANLQAHYKAIRARLNAGPPKPPPAILPEPEPDPEPITPPLMALVKVDPMPGVACSPEVKEHIGEILERHNMTWKEAIGPSRTIPFLRARAEIYIMLQRRGWSYPRIGKLCGKRDHTTILNSIHRYRKKYPPPLTVEEFTVCGMCGMEPEDYYSAKIRLQEARKI